jgi:hypothetical protein
MELSLTYPQYRAFFIILFSTDAKKVHVDKIKSIISKKAKELLTYIELDYETIKGVTLNKYTQEEIMYIQTSMSTRFPRTYTESDSHTIKSLLLFIIKFNTRVFGENYTLSLQDNYNRETSLQDNYNYNRETSLQDNYNYNRETSLQDSHNDSSLCLVQLQLIHELSNLQDVDSIHVTYDPDTSFIDILI